MALVMAARSAAARPLAASQFQPGCHEPDHPGRATSPVSAASIASRASVEQTPSTKCLDAAAAWSVTGVSPRLARRPSQETPMSTKTPPRTPLRRTKVPAVAAPRTSSSNASAKATTKRKGTPARSPSTQVSASGSVAPPPASKQARLIALLQSPPDGTLAQMMALTGWQAHSVRGVLSGVLRKKLGLNVQCDVGANDGPRTYRIGAARAAV